MGRKEKGKRKGHDARVRKTARVRWRKAAKRARSLAGRRAEWVDNGWDLAHPEAFKKKFGSAPPPG